MPRVVAKRRERSGFFEKVGELTLVEAVKVVLLVVVSVVMGFTILILGLHTFYVTQENRWLETKIEEMKYELESVKAIGANEISGLETIALDENK